jgi:GDP-D-mannose dehydratase
MKTALITGVTVQDGCYVARSLLQKSYKVYDSERRTTANKYW